MRCGRPGDALISGPVALPTPDRVHSSRVESALQMLTASRTPSMTAAIFSLRPPQWPDYQPDSRRRAQNPRRPVTKSSSSWSKTRYCRYLLPYRPDRPLCGRFCGRETRQVEEYARGKLRDKRLDMIARNDVSRADIGGLER